MSISNILFSSLILRSTVLVDFQKKIMLASILLLHSMDLLSFIHSYSDRTHRYPDQRADSVQTSRAGSHAHFSLKCLEVRCSLLCSRGAQQQGNPKSMRQYLHRAASTTAPLPVQKWKEFIFCSGKDVNSLEEEKKDLQVYYSEM